MAIETAEDLASFFNLEEFGSEAVYSAAGTPDIPLVVLRMQATVELEGRLFDTNRVQIQRSDVAQPREDALLTIVTRDPLGNIIAQERFAIQGGARLDELGALWTCYLEPA